MNDTPSPAPEPPKKKSLLDLLPAKVPVETTLGTIYVRYMNVSDWKHVANVSSDELGKTILDRLSSRNQERGKDDPLSTAELDALSEDDLKALAQAIANQSRWGNLPDGISVDALAELAKAEIERERARHKKQMDEMGKSLDAGYGFLKKDTLSKLKEQLTGISEVRNSMRFGQLPDGLANSMLGTSAYEEAMHGLGQLDAIKGTSASNAYDEVVRNAQKVNVAFPSEPQMSRAMNLREIPRPPRPEESPIGIAALETAQHTEEIARLMAVLADATTGLNQTVVAEILPAWFAQVKSDQSQSEKSIQHATQSLTYAAQSLTWAKWAVAASVAATIIGTLWQVYVAREIDSNNTTEQKNVEIKMSARHAEAKLLLEQQLEAQKNLLEQQGKEAELLRDAIRSMKSKVPAK